MNEQEKHKALEEEEKRITEAISKIEHRIAVFSGKGGVGKTTIAAMVIKYLAQTQTLIKQETDYLKNVKRGKLKWQTRYQEETLLRNPPSE